MTDQFVAPAPSFAPPPDILGAYLRGQMAPGAQMQQQQDVQTGALNLQQLQLTLQNHQLMQGIGRSYVDSYINSGARGATAQNGASSASGAGNMRILCVSERNDVAPMWAHYGGNHSRVVFEFTYREYIDTPLAVARQVTYHDTPPRLATMEQWIESIFDEEPFELTEFFSNYQYQRGRQWEHETEWRVIHYKRGGDSSLYSDWGFDPRELSAIYLGSRIENEAVRDVAGLLRYGLEHVRVYRGVED